MSELTTDILKKKEKNSFVLSHVYNLPSIPVMMLEVNRMLDNPRTSAAELGKVISKDQGLVTKILTVANSPLYGIPRRVATIDFAIVILGFDHIKNIVIALSMVDAFKIKSDSLLDQKKYWMHSIITATLCKRIADDLGYHFSGEAFTAGLLHDLGIPVIHKYFYNDFVSICKNVSDQNGTYSENELATLGLTHQEIGRLLANRWNLPATLSDSILNHHSPLNAEYKEQAALVHLADYMTYRLKTGDFAWDDDFEFDKNVIPLLRLGDEEYLEKFILSYENIINIQLDAVKL
jgi:putative nucleotidyltransferase with HDIG domain